ncbi:MAG: DNA polymerase IV [Candidatus Omnitrophica bacterium]|nr:DNA polymerase IV [Candidatus Omnitrophota bacterium]
MPDTRYIAHIDMDAFFASIEQRDCARLAGLPVVVGADPKGGRGRGVVSTCSYEARKFGIHSAMPISFAYQRCPNAVFLPVNMEKYVKVSKEIYAIFESFTPLVEPLGLDEAFLDITGSYHIFKTPIAACRLLKERIKKETRLTASIGLAPTKMAAKIASDLGKPDGLLEITEDKLLEFLWPLAVDKIPGLGKKSKATLSDYGISTIGDLARRPLREIISLFGKNGEYFWNLAHGRDDRLIEEEAEAKSISNEVTFERDTNEQEAIMQAFLVLCEKVSKRLRSSALKARTITLKLRLKGFDTYTRATTLHKATNFDDIIYREIKKLYEDFGKTGPSERTTTLDCGPCSGFRPNGKKTSTTCISAGLHKKIRLIGVKVSNFIPADTRDSIFVDSRDDKKEKIYSAIDKIKEKFGNKIIHRASSMSDII